MAFHLTPEIARAFRHGQLEQDDLIQIVLEHLPAVCPHCRAGLAALKDEQEPDAALRLATFSSLLEHYEPEVRLAEESASRDFKDLQTEAAGKRKERIIRAHRRFRGVSFVQLLLNEQQRLLHESPAEAYRWAELAWIAACKTPGMPADLLALALAQMGNARRAGGDLRSAEEHFRHVRHLVTRHPVADLSVLAKIHQLEGSLRKDQRRLERAQKLLERSALLYRLLGDNKGLAGCLLKLAECRHIDGKAGDAAAIVRKALRHSDLRTDPELYLWARHNLACYLAEAGRLDEAETLLEEDAPRCREHFAPIDQLRLSWLEGRIAAGRGDFAAAEAAFLRTRDGFLADHIGYPAAMVSLDLALLYAREGRTAELKRLAEEIAPVFQAQDVHREAMAALLLFQQAARQETLTVTTLKALADYLRDARNDSSLRFEPPAETAEREAQKRRK